MSPKDAEGDKTGTNSGETETNVETDANSGETRQMSKRTRTVAKRTQCRNGSEQCRRERLVQVFAFFLEERYDPRHNFAFDEICNL